MNRIKPVLLLQIKTGRPYICMGVALNNHLSLEVKTFWGSPRKDRHGQWIQTGTQSEKNPPIIVRRHDCIFNYAYMTDLGLVIRKNLDNHHRVFVCNPKNMKLLKGLVRRQATTEYLELIGVSNPEEVILRNLEQSLVTRRKPRTDRPSGFYCRSVGVR